MFRYVKSADCCFFNLVERTNHKAITPLKFLGLYLILSNCLDLVRHNKRNLHMNLCNGLVASIFISCLIYVTKESQAYCDASITLS